MSNENVTALVLGVVGTAIFTLLLYLGRAITKGMSNLNKTDRENLKAAARSSLPQLLVQVGSELAYMVAAAAFMLAGLIGVLVPTAAGNANALQLWGETIVTFFNAAYLLWRLFAFNALVREVRNAPPTDLNVTS